MGELFMAKIQRSRRGLGGKSHSYLGDRPVVSGILTTQKGQRFLRRQSCKNKVPVSTRLGHHTTIAGASKVYFHLLNRVHLSLRSVRGASSGTISRNLGRLPVSGRHGASAGSESIMKLRAGTTVSIMQ